MTHSLLALAPLLIAGCGVLDPEPTPDDFRRLWDRVGVRVGRPAAVSPQGSPQPSSPADGVGEGAAPSPPPPKGIPLKDGEWMPIDLPSALQLAGENNLTVRIAAETVAESRGAELQALSQFFPTLLPGYVFNNHQGTIQRAAGDILDVNRNSQRVASRAVLQLNPSRAFFESLQARRIRRAGEFADRAVQNEVGMIAAQQYFDLVRALRQVGIAEELLRQTDELVRINQDRAERGTGLRVDLTRAQARAAEARQFLDETVASFRIIGIRLAGTLQLAPNVVLFPAHAAATPIEFIGREADLDALMDLAVRSNPTLQEQAMLVSAAEKAAEAAKWEVLIPRISAEAVNGYFGNRSTIDRSDQYSVGLVWEITGMGVANAGRRHAAEARLRATELRAEDVRRRLLALVAESHQEVQLQRSLIDTAARQAAAAEESFRLAENRLNGGVGLLLDVLDAQSQLTRARVAQLSAVIEFNKAQYRLFSRLGNRAVAPTP